MKTLARFPRSTLEPPPQIESTPPPAAPAVLRKATAAGRRRPRAGWRSITILAILAAAVWTANWWIDPAGGRIERQFDQQASERIASHPDDASSTR